LNIDPAAVEMAITERTTAIVAVHCYGNPCAVEALDSIARRHGLKLIYDSAHAFGVTYRGRSLLAHGDYSTLSFHATKAFNTFEGGAVVTRTPEDCRTVEFQRNFGIADEVTVPAIGGNAKMSEFNAALGLLQLRRFHEARGRRAIIDSRYREALANLPGLEPLPLPAETQPNFSYFPILVTEIYPLGRDALYEALKQRGIYSRRYFHPLLASLPMYKDHPSSAPENLPVASHAAERILCLPIYPDLSAKDNERVIDALLEFGTGR
jgi:dTDP-4-amino-4,6-dideoxygalactose transaminase